MRAIILLVLMVTFHSQNASAWFSKGKDNACVDVGDMWTPETLSQKTDSHDCTRENKNPNKVVFNCQSKDMAIYNGTITIYPDLKSCESDGGTFDSKKYSEMKTEWAKNYNSKLWVYIIDTCGKNRFECVLTGSTVKESFLPVEQKLSAEGYSCDNAFEVVANSTTPLNTTPMSILCVKRANLCSLAIKFFKSKNECETSLKKEKIKK